MDLEAKIYIGVAVTAVGFVFVALMVSSVVNDGLRKRCEANDGVFLLLRSGSACVKKDVIIPNP